jgi:hypothetical protein
MNIPIKCPCCNKILLNQQNSLGTADSIVWKKLCVDNPNHKFILVWNIKTEHIISLIVSNSTNLFYKFLPLENKIAIFSNLAGATSKRSKTNTQIPYFNPELNNWNKLLNKLKTYTIFS